MVQERPKNSLITSMAPEEQPSKLLLNQNEKISGNPPVADKSKSFDMRQSALFPAE